MPFKRRQFSYLAAIDIGASIVGSIDYRQLINANKKKKIKKMYKNEAKAEDYNKTLKKKSELTPKKLNKYVDSFLISR